ncbi:calmodulin-binding protein 60 D-like [Canna indica]|uniref:Calmodulin-binding protein 60 D-like n=1 Tax=Canna indica TaxID=4628 RepID=A0AAQ3KDH0_9LILI|nr:calmodulin-binding protein 60 D-like [Canna indica]
MMGLKRDVEGEGIDDGGPFLPDTKRQRTSLDSMKVVMAAQYIQQHLPKIEPFLRRVVREEVQSAIWRDVQLTRRVHLNKIESAVSNRYCLQFWSSLPRTLFTSSKIEAEGQKPVEIVIIDSETKQIVTCGPLASIKLEILVLDGDFCVDGQEEWTEKEFSDNIVREREGKRPLLSGELTVTLVNGVGFLGDVNFTDNSSWTRSRRFRLGARVSQNRCNERIQEAVSGAFLVKDHRGELYKKHHPPSLTDDVWRLEKIGKDGVFHKRLADNEIVTVQDFLKNFVMDPDKLRLILGSGMSNKMWEATVEHAKKCIIPEEKLYSYNCGQGLMLLFNTINELLGAIIQDKFYCLDDLPPTQKVLINKLKQDAYRSPGLIMEIIQPLVDNSQRLLSLPTEAFTVPDIRCLAEHNPYSQGDPVLGMGSLHQSNLAGNSAINDLSQMKDMFTGMGYHQVQGSDSLQLNNKRHCFNMPLSNTETSRFAEPIKVDDRLMSLNYEADMLRVSGFPGLFDQSNGPLHVSDGKTSRNCAPDVPQFGAQIFSRKWVKLKAVSRLMAIARRSARRAAFMNSAYPMLSPGIFSDTYGGCW